MTNEILNMKQLDLVSGGNRAQTGADRLFFQKLGYNINKVHPEDAFAGNGVKCRIPNDYYDNEYQILTDGEWTKYPHWAALGYVLAKNHYSGFNGSWTDSNYVHSFLKENLGITNLG